MKRPLPAPGSAPPRRRAPSHLQAPRKLLRRLRVSRRCPGEALAPRPAQHLREKASQVRMTVSTDLGLGLSMAQHRGNAARNKRRRTPPLQEISVPRHLGGRGSLAPRQLQGFRRAQGAPPCTCPHAPPLPRTAHSSLPMSPGPLASESCLSDSLPPTFAWCGAQGSTCPVWDLGQMPRLAAKGKCTAAMLGLLACSECGLLFVIIPFSASGCQVCGHQDPVMKCCAQHFNLNPRISPSASEWSCVIPSKAYMHSVTR